MPYRLKCHPERVSTKEIEGLTKDLRIEVKAALLDLHRFGPQPEGRHVKPLGKKIGYLWQMNLKVNREQVRILYFPNGQDEIVVVSVFTKTSPQEEQREYGNAVARKAQAEAILLADPNGGTSIH